MSDFVNNLVSRHVQVEDNVKPRVRGRFEPAERTRPSLFTQDTSTESYGTSWPAQQIEPYAEQPAGRLPARQSPLPGAVASPHLPGAPAGEWEQAMERRPLEAAVRKQSPAGPSVSPASSEESALVSTSPDAQQAVSKFPQAVAMDLKRQHQDLVEPALRVGSEAGISRAESPSQLNGLLGGPARLPTTQRSSSPSGREQGPAAATPTTIKVTIGRIEVRAVSAPTPATPQPSASPKPLLSLDEYLKRRNPHPAG